MMILGLLIAFCGLFTYCCVSLRLDLLNYLLLILTVCLL